MTTYSITGVQVDRDIDDNVINVTDVALELVFAPNSTAIASTQTIPRPMMNLYHWWTSMAQA